MTRTAFLVGIAAAIILALVAQFAPSIAPSTPLVETMQFVAVGVGAVVATVATVAAGSNEG